MGSLLSINTSDQYKVDLASQIATREQLDAYLIGLTPSNASDIVIAIDTLLPIVNARIDEISKELKSIGRILTDTMNYAQGIKRDIEALSFANINNLLTKSATSADAATVSAAQQIFLDNNFELVKRYRYEASLSEFYSKYSAHLQDRQERLMNSLKTMVTVHDNLTMIRATAAEKAGV